MQTLSGYPYVEVRFDGSGRAVASAEADALLDLIGDTSITDLLVLAHGWNNDVEDAQRLYRKLAASLAGVAGRVAGLNGRNIAIASILWPSKRFAGYDLVPSTATAALTNGVPAEVVQREIDELAGFFPGPGADAELRRARELVPKLDSASARREFADRIRAALSAGDGSPDDGSPDGASADGASPDDGSDRFFRLDGEELMDRLSIPVTLLPPVPAARRPGGGAASLGGGSASGAAGAGPGSAAGLGSIPGGPRGAARNLLNFATYYEMKNRAGTVGRVGLAPLLARVHERRLDIGIHLAGHSFGGRLVAAAATGEAGGAWAPISSLTMLQAAFSHYGFARNWKDGHDGAFRSALTGHRVSGPILITHTGNDKAVGVAYALASRVAGQVGAGVGDRNDTYGGIGRNGALRTPEAVDLRLLDLGGSYDLRGGRVHNLLADEFVKSHSDVSGDQVAYAILSAVAAS